MTEETKILMVSEYPPEKGAVSDYTYHLCEELADRGIEIDVLSESGESSDEEKQVEGVNVIGAIPEHRTGWKSIEMEEYDLMHIQFYITRLKQLLRYKLTGGRTPEILITLHDVPTGLKSKRYFTIFRNVILLTDETQRQFKKEHPVISRTLVKNIFDAPYLGIDKELKQRVDEKGIETNLDQENTNLVCPGFIHNKKAFHKVVELMPELIEEVPDLHLTMSGGLHRYGHEDYLEDLKQKIEETGLQDRIEITGVLPTEDHVNQYIIEADAVALPFEDISQSATLTKTLALGTVPVVTPLDTLKPAINNYGGIMIDEDNPEELKKGILKALRDPPEIKSQKIRGELSWQNNAERHIEIYSDLKD